MKKTEVKKVITSKIDTGRGKRLTTGTLTTTSLSTRTSSSSNVSTAISGTRTSALRQNNNSSARSTSSSIPGSTSTFPRSQNKSRPCHPSKDPSIRAFVQNNARVSNMTALFHDEVDPQNLSAALVKNARKSGVLNLSGRNLISVPTKVWRINELDENERSTVSVALDDQGDDKWWEFVDLQKLIIANNCVKDVPCDISNLSSLQTFDAHDNQIATLSKDIGKLSNLSKLDLSHNKIALLPEEIGELKRLIELNLSHNEMDEIPQNFGNLSCLRILDVSHNNLASFPSDLGFLSFLQVLRLSNNKLSEIPDEIGGLTGLRTLDISDNCLQSCPAGLSDLAHLEILYFQRNKLTEIPVLSNAKNLKELHLQNNLIQEFNTEENQLGNTKVNLIDLRINKIHTLKIACDDLEFLERFYLDNNDITQLPDELALLPSIKALTLDGNPIRGIRIDILQRGTQEVLKYLRGRLRLSDSYEHTEINRGTSPARTTTTSTINAVSSLSAAFTSPPRRSPSRRRSGGANIEELGIDPYKLKASKALVLSSRQITDLELEIFQIAADNCVTCIDLSRNMMTFLPAAIQLCYEWLVELKLDFNRLIDLPACLSKCSRLQYLTLQNNQLTELPTGFSHLKCLREINLGYNRFNSIPPCLYEIPVLEIINMASNKLVNLDAQKLKGICKLTVLDVSNNNIAVMPPEIGLITQLKSLSIEGNAFRVPNYQIISQGTDAVMTYLRNRVSE